ncbi:MAG: tetratricopeptide repeat protein, partial [Cyanobacteria bacterium J06632_3]
MLIAETAAGAVAADITEFSNSVALAQIEYAFSDTTASDITASTSAASQGLELYISGRFAEAIDAWKSELRTAGDDALYQAAILNYLSLAYQELNQWDLAQETIEESIALLETHDAVDSLLWAQTLNTQAALAYHLGQPETALELWEQSEERYRLGTDADGVLGSQINQAQALQSLGFYRRSRQQLEAVAQQLADMPDSALKVNGLRTLGNALQVLGDLSASRAALFESANVAIAINATGELSATYLSLGRTARDWGDLNASMAMFERAKQTALNPSHSLQADLSRLRFYVEQQDNTNSARVAEGVVAQLADLPPSRLSVYGTVNMSASLAKEAQLGQSVPIETINELLAQAVQAARALEDKQAEAYSMGG